MQEHRAKAGGELFAGYENELQERSADVTLFFWECGVTLRLMLIRFS
jgi:hypothetical protein